LVPARKNIDAYKLYIKWNPYSRFQYGIKSKETKRKYVKLLELFFDFCQITGNNIREKAENFFKFAKESGMEETTDLILNYVSFHINRSAKDIISGSTGHNFCKPVNLFGDMNKIVLNSKLITRRITSGSKNSNERISTR
jgi:hypothetical protein